MAPMQIFVRTLTRTITLDVQASDNTAYIKQLIQDREGIPCSLQRLIFSGHELLDGSSLSSSSIDSSSTIHVVCSLLGGGKKKKKKKNFAKPKVIKHKHKKIKLAVLKYYKVEDNKITRLRRECTNVSCGAATFMAIHYDRYSCGKCGQTLVFEEGSK